MLEEILLQNVNKDLTRSLSPSYIFIYTFRKGSILGSDWVRRIRNHLPTTKYLLMCLSSIESVTAARDCSTARLRKLKVTVPAPPKAHTTYAYTTAVNYSRLILRKHAALIIARFKEIYKVACVAFAFALARYFLE